MKKVVVSCGPIPARLDSVKFLTNMFKGGLAFRTAEYLARQPDFEVTIVKWRHTPMPVSIGNAWADACYVVDVADVFEYFDWFVAHARDYDAFVMAAAVANLTPVKPWEGKFPSHEYRPGDEFDIRFMIAPRAIDAIKPLNPRACLIGYKLFDEPDDGKLVDIARHTLEDAKANVIFANRPSEAKSRKIAVMADGTAIPMDFDSHLEFIMRAIAQEYFGTAVRPLSDEEKADPDIREALATVRMYEHTFERYGTVAVPIANRPGMFATTSRGHKGDPVIVRGVDAAKRTVAASGKATLNAPALAAMLSNHPGRIVVHRHFDDPLADADSKYDPRRDGMYLFPGTLEEYAHAKGNKSFRMFCPHHGYLKAMDVKPVDWDRYYELFPDKYFGRHSGMETLAMKFVAEGRKVLEIGGNAHPVGNYGYDPYVSPAPDSGCVPVTLEEAANTDWDLVVSFNAIAYLSEDEFRKLVAPARLFMANVFMSAPEEKSSPTECAVHDHAAGTVRHGLRLPMDGLMRHSFHAYGMEFYESMGLSGEKYGDNSLLLFKDDDGYLDKESRY